MSRTCRRSSRGGRRAGRCSEPEGSSGKRRGEKMIVSLSLRDRAWRPGCRRRAELAGEERVVEASRAPRSLPASSWDLPSARALAGDGGGGAVERRLRGAVRSMRATVRRGRQRRGRGGGRFDRRGRRRLRAGSVSRRRQRLVVPVGVVVTIASSAGIVGAGEALPGLPAISPATPSPFRRIGCKGDDRRSRQTMRRARDQRETLADATRYDPWGEPPVLVS